MAVLGRTLPSSYSLKYFIKLICVNPYGFCVRETTQLHPNLRSTTDKKKVCIPYTIASCLICLVFSTENPLTKSLHVHTAKFFSHIHKIQTLKSNTYFYCSLAPLSTLIFRAKLHSKRTSLFETHEALLQLSAYRKVKKIFQVDFLVPFQRYVEITDT